MANKQPLLPLSLVLSTICLLGATSPKYDDWVNYTFEKNAANATLPSWLNVEGHKITLNKRHRGLAWLKWGFLLIGGASSAYAYNLSQELVKVTAQKVISEHFNKQEFIGQAQLQAMANLQTFAEVAQLRAAEQYQEELLPYLAAQDEMQQKLLPGQSLGEIIDPSDKITGKNDESKDLPESKDEQPTLPKLPVSYFDWAEIKDLDSHPIIRIVGKMGSGKTRLTEWILSWIAPQVFILTPKINPPKEKGGRPDWTNYQVFGAKPALDYDTIEAKLLEIKEEIRKRFTEGYRQPQVAVVLDDWTYTCRAKENIKAINLEIVTTARGAGIGEIMLVHSDNAPASGLDGFADLKEVCTTVRLGKLAINYGLILSRKYPEVYEPVYQWLIKQERPCMVDELPAPIPDLSEYISPVKEINASTRQDLENLYQKNSTPMELLQVHFQHFLKWAKQKEEWLSASKIKSSFAPWKPVKTDDIRLVMNQLVNEGQAISQGEGKKLEIKINPSNTSP